MNQRTTSTRRELEIKHRQCAGGGSIVKGGALGANLSHREGCGVKTLKKNVECNFWVRTTGAIKRLGCVGLNVNERRTLRNDP